MNVFCRVFADVTHAGLPQEGLAGYETQFNGQKEYESIAELNGGQAVCLTFVLMVLLKGTFRASCPWRLFLSETAKLTFFESIISEISLSLFQLIFFELLFIAVSYLPLGH